MNKFILVGGGTGGHCIPMLAVYQKFMELNINCQIITDKRGSFFFKEIQQNDITIIKTPTKMISKLEQLINFPIIFLQTVLLMMNTKSVHIIGFGGYMTLPVLLGAKFTNKKISIHEANAIMGKANRVLSNYASNIFITFNKTKMINERFNAKVHTIGLPLRDTFKEIVVDDEKEFIITIIGGSQGSSSLSHKVSEGIVKFSKKINSKVKVYHQCRPEDVDTITNKYLNNHIECEIRNYFFDMPKKIFESNIIISRSGSSTINEIIYTNKPSILIPFPFAVDNHQFHNANFLKQNSCAEIIKDSDLTADLILHGLLGFYNNPDKVDMIKNKLKGLTHKNTSERMLNYIQDSNVTQ